MNNLLVIGMINVTQNRIIAQKSYIVKSKRNPLGFPFVVKLHYTALAQYHREELEAIQLAVLADDDVLVGDHIVEL